MEHIKLPTGEKLWQSQLPNGLSVFVLPKPGFRRTYAVISTHYGSIDSQFRREGEQVLSVPPGIAHFLEHKLFEEEEGSVFDRFADLGASVNAFTSSTQTSYLFSTTENWQEALIQLIEFVNKPYLTDENVEKEKGIIEQELRMYADHPQRRVYSALLEGLYQRNPIRLDIGGTVESVREITKEQLYDCYYTFYQPGNMALAIAGDVEPKEAHSLIAEHYPEWSHYSGPVERFFPTEPKEVAKDWSEEEMAISRPQYLLGFKHDPIWRGEEILRQQLIMAIAWRLITARSSQHFNELYDKELVSDSFGASFSCHPQFAYSVIGTDTDDPERLHDELTRIIHELRREKLCPTELDRLKRSLYGGHLASYDSFEYAANRVISNHFNQIPSARFLPLLSSITAEQVTAVFTDLLDWNRSSVSILRVKG